MSFTLTTENYFSKERPHISNSMISTYIKSPALYKRRYIDNDPSVQLNKTDSMKRGSVLDDFLTRDGDTQYVSNPYDGRTKEGKDFKALHDPDYIISDKILSEVAELYDAIHAQPFWQEGKDKRIFQLPLQGYIADTLVCGLPDWIDSLGNDQYRIVDLKTTTPGKTASVKKWFMNAQDFGYYRQAAMYQYLCSQHFSVPIDNLPFFWCTVAPIEPGLVQIKLFRASQDHINLAFTELVQALEGIKAQKFEDKLLTWDDAEFIGVVE